MTSPYRTPAKGMADATPEAVAAVRRGVSGVLTDGGKALAELAKKQEQERTALLASLVAKIKAAGARLEEDKSIAGEWADMQATFAELDETCGDAYLSAEEEAQGLYDEAGDALLEYLGELEDTLKEDPEDDEGDDDE